MLESGWMFSDSAKMGRCYEQICNNIKFLRLRHVSYCWCTSLFQVWRRRQRALNRHRFVRIITHKLFSFNPKSGAHMIVELRLEISGSRRLRFCKLGSIPRRSRLVSPYNWLGQKYFLVHIHLDEACKKICRPNSLHLPVSWSKSHDWTSCHIVSSRRSCAPPGYWSTARSLSRQTEPFSVLLER